MAKRQILTNAEIEKDIIAALKKPPNLSKASYKKSTIPGFIIAVFLVVIEFINPIIILWLLLAMIPILISNIIFNHFRLKHQIQNVTINNYDITTEIVHSTAEEHYKAVRSTGRWRHTEQVDNYNVRFENGKIWHIPKELYAWDERLRNQDLGIYRIAHRGDNMIVVTEKDKGKIVIAYHTDIFEYKN